MNQKLILLKEDIQKSLKSGDSFRVETLRFLLSALRNKAIEKYGNRGEEGLTDDDFLDVVKKQVKSHKESIDAYTKAKRADLANKEQDELAILSTFLPEELSDEELVRIVKNAINVKEKNFGMLMKQAMQAVSGRADGGRVSGIVKELTKEAS